MRQVCTGVYCEYYICVSPLIQTHSFLNVFICCIQNCLANMPQFVFCRIYESYCWIVVKIFFVIFQSYKVVVLAIYFNGFSTSLFLKIFSPSILICFFILLPVFFYFKVMAFFIIWLKRSTKRFSQNYCSQESGWLPRPVAHQITGHIDFLWKYFGTLMWSHIR